MAVVEARLAAGQDLVVAVPEVALAAGMGSALSAVEAGSGSAVEVAASDASVVVEVVHTATGALAFALVAGHKAVAEADLLVVDVACIGAADVLTEVGS